MESNWAAEHLQTIRTLMERAALYRRALAPIMLFAGLMGVIAAGAGLLCRLDSPQAFGGLWLGTAIVVVAGAFLIARRQALKESEPFWSPPTRRVAQALLPPLFIGSIAGLLALLSPTWDFIRPWALPPFWILLYGCALTAAGFFMQRGIKLLGWIFILCGCVLMATRCYTGGWLSLADGHRVMGGVFGGCHLGYGIYLYFTESRRNET